MNSESSIDTYTLSCVEKSQWEVAAWHRELSLVLCDELERWDGRWVGGRLRREGMYVYMEQYFQNSRRKRARVYLIQQKNSLTCAVPFLHVQGKATIATALETPNRIPALAIGAHPGKRFALIDIYKQNRVGMQSWSKQMRRSIILSEEPTLMEIHVLK